MVWAILGVIAFLVFLVVFPKFTIGYIVVIGLVIGVMLYAVDQRKKERDIMGRGCQSCNRNCQQVPKKSSRCRSNQARYKY